MQSWFLCIAQFQEPIGGNFEPGCRLLQTLIEIVINCVKEASRASI
jgi:hypothetical protein